jgi:hypothetical protein
MLFRRKGRRYDGPVAYCDDYHLVKRPGYYALTKDGKRLRRPLLRLTWVDHAPGVPGDISGHYEVASKTDPPIRPLPRNGEVVNLQTVSEGNGEVVS